MQSEGCVAGGTGKKLRGLLPLLESNSVGGASPWLESLMSNTLSTFLSRAARAADADIPQVSDAELVRRFVCDRDAAAFELLLWRHGPMVWGLCRRQLGHTHDAE